MSCHVLFNFWAVDLLLKFHFVQSVIAKHCCTFFLVVKLGFYQCCRSNDLKHLYDMLSDLACMYKSDDHSTINWLLSQQPVELARDVRQWWGCQTVMTWTTTFRKYTEQEQSSPRFARHAKDQIPIVTVEKKLKITIPAYSPDEYIGRTDTYVTHLLVTQQWAMPVGNSTWLRYKFESIRETGPQGSIQGLSRPFWDSWQP